MAFIEALKVKREISENAKQCQRASIIMFFHMIFDPQRYKQGDRGLGG